MCPEEWCLPAVVLLCSPSDFWLIHECAAYGISRMTPLLLTLSQMIRRTLQTLLHASQDDTTTIFTTSLQWPALFSLLWRVLGGGIGIGGADKLGKLVRKASSVMGMGLESVEAVNDVETKGKLNAIINNLSKPLYADWKQKKSRSSHTYKSHMTQDVLRALSCHQLSDSKVQQYQCLLRHQHKHTHLRIYKHSSDIAHISTMDIAHVYINITLSYVHTNYLILLLLLFYF